MNKNQNEQEYLVQKIRAQYTEREYTQLDELRELDSKVKRPVKVLAYILGSLAALVMGAGMSLVMTDIGATVGVNEPMLPGVVIGVVGMLLAVVNYPLHQKLLRRRRRKYAGQIVVLSDRVMQAE